MQTKQKVKVFLYRKNGTLVKDNDQIKVPKDMQERILKVVNREY